MRKLEKLEPLNSGDDPLEDSKDSSSLVAHAVLTCRVTTQKLTKVHIGRAWIGGVTNYHRSSANSHYRVGILESRHK